MRLASQGWVIESLRSFIKKFLSTIIIILLFNSNAFADILVCDFNKSNDSLTKFIKVDKKWCLATVRDAPMMDSCSIDSFDKLIIQTRTSDGKLNITWNINRYTGKAEQIGKFVMKQQDGTKKTLTEKHLGICNLNQKKKF